jgi:alginate O-acetyltransferase complex protein AlgJ
MSVPSTFQDRLPDDALLTPAASGPRALLSRARRYLGLAAFIVLATPLAVGFIHPDSAAEVLREGRRLASTPALPRTAGDWRTFPSALDAYLSDHFGLRSAMIRLHKDLTKPVARAGDASVLIGRDGRMFYLGQDAVRQSAGQVIRDQRVADTIDVLSAMRAELAQKGIGFLVAVPPNAATVYQDDLPTWARNPGRSTEYDLLVKGLAARGVKTIDLRPVMAAVRATGPIYYRHDSHWTPRGALAGYDAIVSADGHPDWRADPRSALTPPVARHGGDLARLLGVEDSVTEEAEEFTAPEGTRMLLTPNLMGDYVMTSGRPGPTIMILGDSFTNGHFIPLVLQHAGKVVWLAHKWCTFDWSAIDRFHPDEVWWIPTERFFLCNPGVRPLKFPVAPR